MRKTILSSVSALALMIGGASAVMADDTVDADADISVETQVDSTQVVDGDDYVVAMLGDYSATDLIDADVYGPGGEEIAEASDLVIDANNNVSHVLVDVGGFLGIGEKVVALDAAEVEIMQEADDADDLVIVTSKTEADLESMAAFEDVDDGYYLQSDWDMHTEGEVTN